MIRRFWPRTLPGVGARAWSPREREQTDSREQRCASSRLRRADSVQEEVDDGCSVRLDARTFGLSQSLRGSRRASIRPENAPHGARCTCAARRSRCRARSRRRRSSPSCSERGCAPSSRPAAVDSRARAGGAPAARGRSPRSRSACSIAAHSRATSFASAPRARDAPARTLHQRREAVVGDVREQLFLVAEVEVDGALGDARLVRDPLHRCILEAELADHATRGLDDLGGAEVLEDLLLGPARGSERHRGLCGGGGVRRLERRPVD